VILGRAAVKTNLPHLVSETDRHGNERVYVRRYGRRMRLRPVEGSPEFVRAYADALDALNSRAPRLAAVSLQGHPKGSLGFLGALYFGANEFRRLATASQRARRNCLEECFRVAHKDGDPDPMGNCPLTYLTAKKIRRMIEATATAGAQANRRKHLSALCGWGVDHDYLGANPARDVRTVKGPRGGYYTWTIADVGQFMRRHPAGTRPFLALALLLFTGSRRQDMVTFGRQHVRDGWLRFVPKKTLYRRRDISQKPWLPILAAIVAKSPCGSLTFLETSHRKPFTANGFGNWFRVRCDEAGLAQCTAHGLKKAGATIAAENGATNHQLMAIFDWTTLSQAQVYTEQASRKRLAGEGMAKIDLGEIGNGLGLTLLVSPKIAASDQ
jgi:integrase